MQHDQSDSDSEHEFPCLIEDSEQLASFILNGWLVDGRSGGLVRGRLHSQGHILMVQPSIIRGAYQFVGYMEGGEYLMSVGATAAHFHRLEEINADKDYSGPKLPEHFHGRVIDTAAEPHDKILLVYQQFIINRTSTRKYLDELVELNAPHPFYAGRVFNDDEIAAMRLWP